ncbi:MAG TPA: hypothetical protein PKH93_12880, partial [Chitinophagales bacterium]|nr:hypothetical protein [Chitinophagales bacterium]
MKRTLATFEQNILSDNIILHDSKKNGNFVPPKYSIIMLVSEQRLFSRAAVFAAFVCFYNIAEGIVAMLMGYKDESLTLFGFGVDSFIEVSSNLGVLYMIFRIRENPLSDRSPFERTALNITGYSFYALAVTLVIGIALSIITEHRPTNTF